MYCFFAYNVYKYKKALKHHDLYTLSHKFQLKENIKVIGLLWKAALVATFNIIIIVFVRGLVFNQPGLLMFRSDQPRPA